MGQNRSGIYEHFKMPVEHAACLKTMENGAFILGKPLKSRPAHPYSSCSQLCFCSVKSLLLRTSGLSSRIASATTSSSMFLILLVSVTTTLVYFSLDCVLAESGYTLENFPKMPICHREWSHLNGNHLITKQLSYDIKRELQSFQQYMQNIQTVSKQLEAYQCIVDTVLEDLGTVFFLSSPGGIDKTYVYKTICHRLQSAGKFVLCVALSGIAALLLSDEHTAHCTFHISIDSLDAESLCNISKQDKCTKLLLHMNDT